MWLRSLLLPAVAAAACLACLPARAAPGDEGLSSGAATREWYGWQILLVDVASTALVVSGPFVASDGGPAAAIPIAGAAGYLAGGPVVHLAHGEGRRAARSALLRVLIPVGAGALGAGLGYVAAGSGPRTTEMCSDARACLSAFGGALGFGAGTLAAMIVDWSTARAPASGPAAQGPEGATWTPVVVVGPRTKAVGLALRF